MVSSYGIVGWDHFSRPSLMALSDEDWALGTMVTSYDYQSAVERMSNEIQTIPTCTHCARAMVEGFIADVGHGGFVNVGTWIEGFPEKTAIGSAKTTFRDRYLLQAFRCPQCGRVEMFALEKRVMPL